MSTFNQESEKSLKYDENNRCKQIPYDTFTTLMFAGSFFITLRAVSAEVFQREFFCLEGRFEKSNGSILDKDMLSCYDNLWPYKGILDSIYPQYHPPRGDWWLHCRKSHRWSGKNRLNCYKNNNPSKTYIKKIKKWWLDN